jgi:hypothetical protein
LQDYSNPTDVGSTWVKIGGAGVAKIEGDVLSGSGASVWKPSGQPMTPDYAVRFDVIPASYTTVLNGPLYYALGRATSATAGYRVMISSDGAQYTLTLTVLASGGVTVSVPMGTISSGFYTAWLELRGNVITAQVQRSEDDLWLRNDATWQPDAGATAARFTDSHYTAPGFVLVGGDWSATGAGVPYDLKLIHLDELTLTLNAPGNLLGFPLTFNYLLFSCWLCLSGDGASRAFQWSNLATMFNITINRDRVQVVLVSGPGLPVWFNGLFNHSFVGPIANVQVSVNALTGTVQCYVNDVALTLSSGGATLAPVPFSITAFWCDWLLDAEGAGPPGVGIGDIYTAAPAAFFDLTVTANRRKFQNADLSPVDIGVDGSGPLGVQPAVYLTGRSGVANDLGTNNGTGGPLTITPAALPLSFLSDGTCTTPWPPPGPPPPMPGLDNVVCTIYPLFTSNLVSLRWSDDRGHSWGSWVTQSIGEAGEYRTSLQWQRLAYARDRCFEISWSVAMPTALQGCFVDVTPAQS